MKKKEAISAYQRITEKKCGFQRGNELETSCLQSKKVNTELVFQFVFPFDYRAP